MGESLELRDEVKATMKTFVLSKIYNEDTGVTSGHGSAPDDSTTQRLIAPNTSVKVTKDEQLVLVWYGCDC